MNDPPSVNDTPSVFADVVEREPAISFAREHFGEADLGHKKRNACLVRVAQVICRHPGGTLPHKLANPSDYKAMDNLMNRPEVTHGSVVASHLQRTQVKMAAVRGVVLLLHDTTDLDYSGLAIPELGPIGNGGGRGYLCHNSLAVDPERKEVLGLAHQILHRRVAVGKKEGVKASVMQKPREPAVERCGRGHGADAGRRPGDRRGRSRRGPLRIFGDGEKAGSQLRGPGPAQSSDPGGPR